jgi:transposase InsO family protein
MYNASLTRPLSTTVGRNPALVHTWLLVLHDLLIFALNLFRSRNALVAENLFLRKQLAFYKERKAKLHRATNATRLVMALLARLFDWRAVLVVVQPDTLLRWRRLGVRLYWKWRSRLGRPRLDRRIRNFIRVASVDNPTWGEERIQNEVLLKLGVRLSARTVRKYMLRRDPRRRNPGSQTWTTFVRSHANAAFAADFLTVFTVRFQLLFVLVIMEIESRRILRVNVTPHPTSAWISQQFREALPFEHPYRFVILDRDILFSPQVRSVIEHLGVQILQTPPRAPKANAFCERLIGTLRRECLDFLIPLSENHLRRALFDYRDFYNRGRPHASLGPGFPEPSEALPVPLPERRHELPDDARIVSIPILGGLHHDYRLLRHAA